jgi:hypothetical protein
VYRPPWLLRLELAGPTPQHRGGEARRKQDAEQRGCVLTRPRLELGRFARELQRCRTAARTDGEVDAIVAREVAWIAVAIADRRDDAAFVELPVDVSASVANCRRYFQNGLRQAALRLGKRRDGERVNEEECEEAMCCTVHVSLHLGQPPRCLTKQRAA